MFYLTYKIHQHPNHHSYYIQLYNNTYMVYGGCDKKELEGKTPLLYGSKDEEVYKAVYSQLCDEENEIAFPCYVLNEEGKLQRAN